jgi:hypothetical protein
MTITQKYYVPGPRYTSYPTVPFWDEQSFSKQQYLERLKKSFQESNASQGISFIYICHFVKIYVHFVVVIRELPNSIV